MKRIGKSKQFLITEKSKDTEIQSKIVDRYIQIIVFIYVHFAIKCIPLKF